MIIHLPLAILAGALGGAIWGMIPGYLKARFGAHEVVNTIMMNWIAFRFSDWLLNGPMKAPGFRPVTPTILETAELPRFFADPLRFNLGFFIALLVAYLVYWFLFKTTLGFEIRSVGANPDAAKYAGMSVIRNFVLVMFLAGGLAGLAGASQVLGVDHWVGQGFSAGYGFDAIALALLGRSHPFGVVLAALLFGFLRSGATDMQSMARIPIDIISIIQGMVIVFIAAPDIIRWLYRIRAVKKEEDRPHSRLGQLNEASMKNQILTISSGSRKAPPHFIRHCIDRRWIIHLPLFALNTQAGAMTTFGLNLPARKRLQIPDLVVPALACHSTHGGDCRIYRSISTGSRRALHRLAGWHPGLHVCDGIS